MRRTGSESATRCWMLSFFTQKPVNSRLVLESIWGRRFSIPQSDSKARFVLDIQIQIRDVSVSLSFLFRSLSFFLFLSLCLGQDESQSTPGQMVKWTRSSGELISDSWERWTPLKRRKKKKKRSRNTGILHIVAGLTEWIKNEEGVTKFTGEMFCNLICKIQSRQNPRGMTMVNNKHPNPEDENKKAPDDDDTSSWGHSTGFQSHARRFILRWARPWGSKEPGWGHERGELGWCKAHQQEGRGSRGEGGN